jgi:ketosteroid isomerase-like protein
MPERAPEVEHAVRRWLAAKQAADGTAIAAALSTYSGALAVGTDTTEWWSGNPEFAEAHTGGGPFSATIEHVEAHREGPVAWAAVRAAVDIPGATRLDIRLTLVLVEDGSGEWRIVQSHASTGDPV